MNARIRVLAFFLSLLLCLSLAACNQQPVLSETGCTTAGTDNSTTAADTPTTEGTTAGIQIGTVDVQTLREGNWNTATMAEGSFDMPFLSGERGYYYLINGHLYFYDPAANISVVLCQKAGCLHENEIIYKQRKTCEAFIDGWHIFAYDSGYIYYDKNDHGEQLYRRNADGTGEMHIATLGEKYTDSEHSVQFGGYLFSDGFLYYTISVNNIELNPDGSLEEKTEFRALLRLDLTTGKEEEVMRVADIGINLIAAKEDAILYATMDADYYKIPNGPDRLEGMFNTPVYTYLWTTEEGVSQELLCKPYRENRGVDGFENGVITSSNYDTGTPYTYDLVTGEYRELSVPHNSVKLNDQLYILEDQITIYNVQTGETLINEFADQCPSEFDMITCDFFAGSKDGILLRRSYYIEDSISFVEKESSISFVSFEALTDGLHIQDAIEIMSEKYRD